MVGGFTHESTYNESKEWYTPRFIFDALNVEFDLDPCSPGKDVVSWIPAKRHLTPADNGLLVSWEGQVWMNPPYGVDTPLWFRRLAEYGNGIALVFARTDTLWFHKYAPKADVICFLNGRVNFVPNCKAKEYADGRFDPKRYYVRDKQGRLKKKSPGAPSMLVAFGEKYVDILAKSGLGFVMKAV